MHWQYSPYAPPLALSAIICLTLAGITWRRRSARGAITLTYLLLAAALLSLTYMLELVSVDLTGMVFWAKVQWLVFLSLPALWLAFVLIYTGHASLLTWRKLTLALIVPAFALVMVWTNEYHYWFYRSTTVDTSGPSAILALTYGPVFWFQGIYTYGLVLAGCVLIFQASFRAQPVYHEQALILLLSALVPLAGNTIYMLNLSPFPHLHLTPFAFTLSGLALAWGLWRYHLLDVTPVARAVLFDSIDDPVIVLDAHSRVVDLNAAGQNIFNLPAAQTIGQPVDALFGRWPGLPPEKFNPNVGRAELTLNRDGTVCDFEMRVSQLAGLGGDLTGRLLVLRDIAERKEIERAAQEQERFADALRKATASLVNTLNFDTILDRILIAAHQVMPYDCSSLILLEEDTCTVARVTDYTDGQLASGRLGHNFPVSEAAHLCYMLETGQAQPIPDTHDYAFWMPDPGSEWVCSRVGAPIRDNARVAGFIILDSLTPDFYGSAHATHLQVLADSVTIALQNARLYTSLGEAYAELESALQAKDEMIQNVSHELRSPIAILKGYLELFEDGTIGALDEAQVHTIRVMRQQANHLQIMVERMLTLQSFKPGQLQREPLDLSPWLAERVQAWLARGENQQIHLRLETPDQLPYVLADAYFMAQVFDNLVDNAFKFSPAGSEVTVSAKTQDEEVIVAIRDQGIGIAPEDQERIFTRFYQVDGTTTRTFGGMGIGLALVSTIVGAHGGRIWLESEGKGRGACFYVALKIKDLVEGI
jgi:PAS domain S-box-containing protein